MKEIVLSGTSFEIGQQHGALLKSAIRRFINDGFAQINTLSNKRITTENLSKYVLPYAEIIREEMPEMYHEICGLADGACISVEEAVLLQIRRELIGIGNFTLAGDCSAVGFFRQMDTLVAQTIDLNGNMTALGNVFKIRRESKPAIIQYSFAGLLGYMGMNDAGLAVAINLVVSDGWKIGVPPYLISRKFLEYKSVSECLQLLDTITVASSRSFLIADANRLVNVEITPDGYSVEESTSMTHTNHFCNKNNQHSEKLNIFSKNSSIRRKMLLDDYLKDSQDEMAIRLAFKDHSLFPVGICAHNEGNLKLNEGLPE